MPWCGVSALTELLNKYWETLRWSSLFKHIVHTSLHHSHVCKLLKVCLYSLQCLVKRRICHRKFFYVVIYDLEEVLLCQIMSFISPRTSHIKCWLSVQKDCVAGIVSTFSCSLSLGFSTIALSQFPLSQNELSPQIPISFDREMRISQLYNFRF